MILTPQKPVRLSKTTCCLCLDPAPNKHHKFGDPKCRESEFVVKIEDVLGVDVASLENHRDAGVCGCCYRKVANFHTYQQEATKYLQDYKDSIESSTRVKRVGNFSPCTPTGPINTPTTSNVTLSERQQRSGKRAKVRSVLSQKFTSPANLPPPVPVPTPPPPPPPPPQDEKKPDISWPIQDSGLQWKKTDDKHWKKVLSDIYQECQQLCTKTLPMQSVLGSKSSMKSLHDSDDFISSVLLEMKTRCPLLLDVLMTVCTSPMERVSRRHIAPLVAAYSILMNTRYHELTAFQRITTAMAIKGNAQDSLITQLNAFHITQSTTSKLRRLEEAGKNNETLMIRALQKNPLAKITGDNLDLYVRTSQQTSEKKHKGLHYFTSNLMQSRAATVEMDGTKPQVRAENLHPEHVVPNQMDFQNTRNAYAVLVGRIFAERIPAFHCMSILPDHIPHAYSQQMAQKSQVYSLPMVFKNEAKYDDCLDIMDKYEEQLINLYSKAHGNIDALKAHKVVLGGDQLTRVRLAGAKELRKLAPVEERRFEHIEPIVIEMWHNKQDFLHKAYSTLYKKASSGEPGTLSYFKKTLGRSDVNGNVKSNYAAHEDLLLSLTKCLIVEQALEFFGMASVQDKPTIHCLPPGLAEMSKEEQLLEIYKVLHAFLEHYGYAVFSLDERPPLPPYIKSAVPPPDVQVTYVPVLTENNQYVLVPMLIPTAGAPTPPNDELSNYCMNVCHWGLHLMNMNDTAKEGDVDRVVTNAKTMVPFFHSHSKLSKYLVENVDYVLYVNHRLSPRESLRVREGSFVNTQGGKGKNIEADLRQEHSVRNRKDLIRHLGANKTEHAINCVTLAADTIAGIVLNICKQLNIPKSSGRHTKLSTEGDLMKIATELRKLRPFHPIDGRQCAGFPDIQPSPLMKNDPENMKAQLRSVIDRLLDVGHVEVAAEELYECDDDNDDF